MKKVKADDMVRVYGRDGIPDGGAVRVLSYGNEEKMTVDYSGQAFVVHRKQCRLLEGPPERFSSWAVGLQSGKIVLCESWKFASDYSEKDDRIFRIVELKDGEVIVGGRNIPLPGHIQIDRKKLYTAVEAAGLPQKQSPAFKRLCKFLDLN